MQEEWRTVKGFEGSYEVANNGLVRSLERRLPHNNWLIESHLVAIAVNSRTGYSQVTLYKKSKNYPTRIHRLVAEAFVDNPLKREEVNHKDGVKTNNRAENLEWVSRSENQKHAYRLGLLKVPHPKGEKHPTSKLTVADVREIREMITKGKNSREIADIFSVSQGCILHIKWGLTWFHVL